MDEGGILGVVIVELMICGVSTLMLGLLFCVELLEWG